MAWQSTPTTPAPAVQRAQQQSTGSPQPNSQMMPPPPRPNKEEKEEKGVDDVTDVMHGSGINLKDEENYLHTLYTNQHSKDSFATQGSSFGSGTLSGGNSFNTLQGTSFDGQNGNGAFAGTLGQAASQDDIEKEAKRKREVAAREKAERDQHHLNNPFLLGNVLRLRMDKIARESGVRLDVNGLYLLQQPTEPTKVMTNGTNSEGIVRAGSKIDQSAPFSDILSLVSLAAGERARGLLDEAHALARARLYGDHNRVPPDLSDLAIATGNEERKEETLQSENITGTEWDRLPDAPGGPEDKDKDTNDTSSTKPHPTISFQSKITTTFRSLAEADRLAEAARLRKRELRRKAAEAAAANDDGAAAEAEITAATSNETKTAPTGPDQPKMTKKEQMKQQKEAKNAVEAQSSTTTNQTAAMMAMGKKGKKYSWMSGGPTHTNRYVKPGAGSGSASGGTSTPIKKEGAGTPTGEGEKDDAGMVRWGDFKEEKGVQLRDWVGVLERDGRERVALQRALNSLK
jgi:sarcosine oxidase gamma subunit